MLLRRIFKNRGFTINMIACAGFLCLAVYGWGLSIRDLLSYFFIAVGCLAVIVAFAVGAGYLLRKFTKSDE